MKNEGPFLKTRVHPKLLYSTKSNTKILRVKNPFEYALYLQKKKEYLQSQNDLLQGYSIDPLNLQQFTYSVKTFGVNNKEGKFGVQSQRRPMFGSFQNQQLNETTTGTERIQYNFPPKRLVSSKKEKRNNTYIQEGFFSFPQQNQIQHITQPTALEKIFQKSRRKIKTPQSQQHLDIKSNLNLTCSPRNKFHSYSRLLSETNSVENFQKLISPR